MWKVFATVKDNNGVRVDASTPEFLGDAFGRPYSSKSEAEEMASLLESEIEDYDLPESLQYKVEEIT